MKTLVTFFIASLFISFCSCQQDNTIPNKNRVIQLDEKSAQLVEADNTFGFEIFQKIREKSNNENIMISPLSISGALAMVYNGANGETKAEMKETLNLNGMTIEDINASHKLLIAALRSLDEKVVFEIANAIFCAQGFPVKSDFININKTNYDAKIESLNFSSPSAVEAINNWVTEKTHDKIQSIIEQLNPLDRMVLLNAIYFNGTWSKKFDEDGTTLKDFKKSDGTTIEIPMMNKEDKLDYTSNELFHAIKLPYGSGQYNMTVLLPADGKDSQDIIDGLSAENWTNWTKGFEVKEHVVVTMPRFKFAFEQKLNDVLYALGIQKAFQPSIADFSKISDEDLYINSVRHKSFIDVNENGTEAAAVTSITLANTIASPNNVQKTYFTVDKPFVFCHYRKRHRCYFVHRASSKPEI